MAEEKYEAIVTLLVEEGNKPGQPIASYRTGGRSYLVFMPDTAVPGKEARVRLVDTGRKDKRGDPLYRGVPAVPITSSRWRDNGNGSAIQVTVETDWLGAEHDAEIGPAKELGKDVPHPVKARKTVRYTVDFSTAIAMATVLETTETVTPRYDEKVENGQLVWVEAGTHTGASGEELFSVKRIGDIHRQFRTEQLTHLVWDASWPIQMEINITNGAEEKTISESRKWCELPAWVQDLLQVNWPVCSCTRERVAKAQGHKADEYPQCAKCRSEASCNRCSKSGQSEKLNYISGKLVCQPCGPYEAAEHAILTGIPHDRLNQIAAEAARLLVGHAVEAPGGIIALRTTLGHITTEWKRDQILRSWDGYPWYYFTDEGVFGSKFAPTALRLLQCLPNAAGNGLVECVAWLYGGHRSSPTSDYFTRSQVAGERMPLPAMSDTIRAIADGSLTAAVRLRDGEAKRLEAERAIKKLEATPFQNSDNSLLHEILDLYRSSGDYNAVIEKIKALESQKEKSVRHERRRKGQLRGGLDWRG